MSSRNKTQVTAHREHKVVLQDDDETDRGAPQGQRDWLPKMGELVEEGEWINKSVLSASLGPAQSFKRVDVGSSVSTFFSLLFSSLLLLLLSLSSFHMADSTSSSPSCPIQMASLPLRTHTPACTHTAHPSGCILLTGGLCAVALWGLCHPPRFSPPSPDVGIINEAKSRFCPPGSRQPGPNICRGSRSAAAAFWLHWCRRREKTRGCGARPSLLSTGWLGNGESKILRHVWEAAKFSTPPRNKAITSAPMAERSSLREARHSSKSLRAADRNGGSPVQRGLRSPSEADSLY